MNRSGPGQGPTIRNSAFVPNSIILALSEQTSLKPDYNPDGTRIKAITYTRITMAGNEWIHNDTISNSLDYLDAMQSAYGMFNGPLGKFEYQMGFRAEYDNRNLKQLTSDESYTYEKFHFFPSFYVIRKLTDAHKLQFTYSRRIQRPDERDLNPFIEYRGSNNVSYGNPALTPEFTNSFELNYQYTFKKGSVSLESYYRGTTDKITRITGVDPLNGKQVFTILSPMPTKTIPSELN